MSDRAYILVYKHGDEPERCVELSSDEPVDVGGGLTARLSFGLGEIPYADIRHAERLPGPGRKRGAGDPRHLLRVDESSTGAFIPFSGSSMSFKLLGPKKAE